MPFIQRINMMESIAGSETLQLILELQTLRAELDDIRSAYTATRALLVAGTAPGAGYNVATNNVPPTVGYPALVASTAPKFTPT